MSVLVSRRAVAASVAALVLCLSAGGAAAQGQPNAGAAATPVMGGTLSFAINPEPPFLLGAINSTLQMGMVTSKIMEGLLSYDVNMNPQPLLAESWSKAADGLSYTFKLRQGVKWHDGRPFTSADVAYSLMSVWKPLHPRGRSTFSKVTAVDTPDAHTVVIRLSGVTPQLLSALSSYESPVVPRHLFEGKDVATNPLVNAPVGTGPFVFKEWKKGDHILLEKNPNYWQAGKPYLDKIVFRVINDASSRAAALESGEVHLAGLSPVPLNDVVRLAKLPHLAVETKGYDYMSPVYMIEFNTRKGPMADPKVRQAFAHAIDRAALTRIVWFGFGAPATSPVPSTIKAFHSPPADVQYKFDVKKAEQLLDEAGYKRGADGKRFKITHDFLPLGTDYQRTAEFLKQQLARVGVEVEIRSQDLPTYYRRIFTDYDFDTTSGYYGAFPDPVQGLQRLYWSKAAAKGVVFTNATGYSSGKMDSILEGAQSENDVQKRFAMFADMQKVAMTDLPVLPLMEMRFFTIASRKLHNHTVTSDGLIGGNFADAWLSK